MLYQLKHSILLTFLVLSFPLAAQSPYRLMVDELFERGIENSLVIRESVIKAQLSDDKEGLAKNKRLPDIVLGGLAGYVGTPLILDKDLSYLKQSETPDWKQNYQVSVSQQQYDQVKSDYEAQKARYNALLRQKESLKSVSVEASKRQGNAEAIILRRKTDLEMAKLNLSYTVITAPYSGYIGRRTLEAGQLVQAGQTITNLIKNDKKWIIANYREKQIEHVYIGQEVRIRVDAINGKVFKGRISAITEAIK